MKKKMLWLCAVVVSTVFIMTGCITGEIITPSKLLSGVKVLRYITAEKEDGKIIWNGTDKDENGQPIPVPTMADMEGTSMRMDNYLKISFKMIPGKKDTIIAVKFNIIADRDGSLRIVIRNNQNLLEDPIFVKVFELEANMGDGFVLAGFEFTAKDECFYIGNEPPIKDMTDYDGYKMKWKIKDLEIVTAVEE